MVQMCQTGHTVFNDSCKSCRILKSEWYDYLGRAGFTDIENSHGDIIDHKTGLDFIAKNDFHTQIQFDAKQNYYQWARSKLHDGNFQDDRDKLIWELHVEGVSSRQISPRVGLEQSWTVRKINKIKDYLKDQLEAIGSMSFSQAIS